jgi:hypothetical protein
VESNPAHQDIKALSGPKPVNDERFSRRTVRALLVIIVFGAGLLAYHFGIL